MNRQCQTRGTLPMLCLAACMPVTTLAADAWQERYLLSPSAQQQRMEHQGRVYIYDGLHEETVDRALDTQFHRMQNMMFIDMQRSTVDGEVYEDDDC